MSDTSIVTHDMTESVLKHKTKSSSEAVDLLASMDTSQYDIQIQSIITVVGMFVATVNIFDQIFMNQADIASGKVLHHTKNSSYYRIESISTIYICDSIVVIVKETISCLARKVSELKRATPVQILVQFIVNKLVIAR